MLGLKKQQRLQWGKNKSKSKKKKLKLQKLKSLMATTIVSGLSARKNKPKEP